MVRVTDKSETTIDHVYTTDAENIIEVNVPKYSISDHYPVCVTRKLNPKVLKYEHLNIEYRSFKNFNETEFIVDLARTPFYLVENLDDVDEATDLWYQLFLDNLDKHAPKKLRRVKTLQQPEWWDAEINSARMQRDYFHRIKDMCNYRVWRNKVSFLIEKAKERYYQKAVLNSKNIKTIWKYIKNLNPRVN